MQSLESNARTIPLSELARGQTGVISHADCRAEDARTLRAMGLRPNARVRLARLGEPCIVHVLSRHGVDCRIGLARRLASSVSVATA